MINTDEKSKELELLLSTMNRTSLSFLSNLFPEDNFLNYSILIINQTTENKLLTSDYPNIRVINSFEKGLSKSRNLAIQNAQKEVCLLVDDDVKYKKYFKTIIFEAFFENEKADIITFQIEDEKGRLFKNYPDINIHDKHTLNTVNSVGIAFRLKKIKENDIKFNDHFGLGAKFPTADEYIFLRNALNKKLSIYFEPKIILQHDYFSSGKAVASYKNLYARGAFFYKYSKELSYLRLCKHLFLMFKDQDVKLIKIPSAFTVGLKGIKAYKLLLKQGLEIR